MSEAKIMRQCTKCRRTMEENSNFYYYRDKQEKGVHQYCKKCYTMHINLREPSTVLPLLEELDFPFIQVEWDSLVERYGNNPKTTPTAIFGRYVGKMKLAQYKRYTYSDTEKFIEEEKLRALKEKIAKLDQINKYRKAVAASKEPKKEEDEEEYFGDLDETVAAQLERLPELDEDNKTKGVKLISPTGPMEFDFRDGVSSSSGKPSSFGLAGGSSSELLDLESGMLSDEEIANLACPGASDSSTGDFDFYENPSARLTLEDKFYLFSKWGKTYTIPECISLEKLWLEMMDSYDIRTASHKDYLLKICRVSLKIDQALECNDIEGYQKMSRVYDVLMKSAKFTAAQIKDATVDYTDSVGVLVGTCEERGFIPHFHTDRQDVVDATLKDMNEYTRKLIMSEMNLGNLIEIHLNKMKQEEDKPEDEMNEEEDLLMVGLDDESDILKDEDFDSFDEMLNAEAEFDEQMLKKSGEM